MWLPTPIYERLPQFWFVLGFLFVAGGAYLGFDHDWSVWYMGIGLVCLFFGVSVYLLRSRSRKRREGNVDSTAQEAENTE